MRVCLVIPMYNEEATAERCVRTVLPYLDALPYATRLCVVNDGSHDATSDILTRIVRACADARLRVVHHERNMGYGAALRTGVEDASIAGDDYVLFMDSDLTNHPRYLTLFYEKMREGWDYIKASRYHPHGSVMGVPRQRQIISRIGNVIARQLYGLPIRDITNGFRAVRVPLLRQMQLSEQGFALIMEELCEAKRLGATFCEVPYTLTSRGAGDGRSHLSYGWRTWKQYLTHARTAARIPYREAIRMTP